MFNSATRSALLLLTVMLCLRSAEFAAQTAPQPLIITTEVLPSGVAGEGYKSQLAAAGGVLPYRWGLETQSKLPPGLTLDPNGAIAGTPTAPGEFRFVVEVADSAPQAHVARRQYTIVIAPAFTIEWRKVPTVEREQITGAVLVTNNTNDAMDLTVIVVAVNETGKAFALGYQHFDLRARSKTPVIPFGSTLPFGRYIVHADAVGEVEKSGRIFRSRLQTSPPLIIAQP